ncbi:MAG: Flp pilus assembly protein CpaB, partial [Kineosporiaceae bacterium]
MGRRSLLLIAAALCAALGTVLVWLYVQGADTRAAAGADLVEVEVTTGDVPADTPAEAVSVRAARVPRDLASGAVTRRQV